LVKLPDYKERLTDPLMFKKHRKRHFIMLQQNI